MPRHRRGHTKSVLSRAKRSRSAAAQSTQIQTLARQVDVLKDASREHSMPTYYTMSYSARTNAYPLVVPLTAGPSTVKQNLKLYSQFVDVILEPGNEEDMLIHTLFLVKLRNDEDGTARRTYTQTLNMKTLTESNDYVSNAQRDGAQAWLNPERYEILKRWELHTCGDEKVEPTPGSAGIIQNMSGAINRFGFKISYSGRHLRINGTNSQINDVLYNDIAPESKYFLIAFSDNSTLDVENPLLSVSSVIKARMF